MLLTNVARASLSDELAKDYKSFLIQRGLRVWHKDSPEALAMRERLKQDVVPNLPPAAKGKVRLTGLAGLSDFVAKVEAEVAANAMLCAVNQAAYLLRRQVEQQSRDFVEKGGFTERLYAARVEARAGQEPGEADSPACPDCGKPMRRRTAGKGTRAGHHFWGCSAYPQCKGMVTGMARRLSAIVLMQPALDENYRRAAAGIGLQCIRRKERPLWRPCSHRSDTKSLSRSSSAYSWPTGWASFGTCWCRWPRPASACTGSRSSTPASGPSCE